MADFVDPVANQENLVQEQQNVVSQRQTDLQTVETRLRQGYDFVGLSENEINNKIQEIKQAGESFNSSNATEMEYKNIYQALMTAQDELESLQTALNGIRIETNLLGDSSLANLALRIDNLTTKVDNIQTFVRQELSNQPNPLLLGVALVTATENGDVQRVGELVASPYLSTFINFKRASDGLCAVDIASQQGNLEILRLLFCTPFTGKISLNDFNTDIINESNWFDIVQNESASQGELQYALLVNPDLINKCDSNGYNALHYAAQNNKKDTELIELLLTHMSLNSINKKNGWRWTPLDAAYDDNDNPMRQEIIALLRSKGGKANYFDENGRRV